jgi:hypothetical protein
VFLCFSVCHGNTLARPKCQAGRNELFGSNVAEKESYYIYVNSLASALNFKLLQKQGRGYLLIALQISLTFCPSHLVHIGHSTLGICRLAGKILTARLNFEILFESPSKSY